MKIKVQYLGPIRALLNQKGEEIEISPEATVYELLRKLSNTYGKEFKAEVFGEDERSIREGLVVTVNGMAIGQLDGIKTRLMTGDIVTLLPLFAGGG